MNILNTRLNIYEQQARNKRTTILLFVIYLILFCVAGAGVDIAMSEQFGGGLVLSVFTIPVIVLMLSYSLLKKIVKASGGWDYLVSSRETIETVITISSVIVIVLVLLYGFWYVGKISDVSFSARQYTHPEEFKQPTGFDFSLPKETTIYFSFPYGTTVGLLLGILTALWGYRNGAKSIVELGETYAAYPEEFRGQQYLNVVKEMSLAAGIPAPEALVVYDEDLNAFALGTSHKESYIVITSGLLEKLDRDELQSVVAHEMSHIRNNDTRVMTLVTILFGSIMFLSTMARRGLVLGVVPKKAKLALLRGIVGIVLFAIWLFTLLLAPFAAKLLALSVSRNREYLADASAAELTRNPEALVRALQKIESSAAPTESIKKGLEHLCIVDPLGRAINENEGFWADLLSTHPPIAKRLTYIRAMAYKQTSIK
jgi:heat shock protein HtpX